MKTSYKMKLRPLNAALFDSFRMGRTFKISLNGRSTVVDTCNHHRAYFTIDLSRIFKINSTNDWTKNTLRISIRPNPIGIVPPDV